MKLVNLYLSVFMMLFMSCNTKIHKKDGGVASFEVEITTNLTVIKDSLVLNGNNGVWAYKSKPYTGYAVQYYANGAIKDKTGFYKGKKHGVYNVWYENKVLKLESFYIQNLLQGSYKSWWSNGILASEVNYIDGKKQGLESKWYYNGKISKKRNLLNDKEDGLQQAWLENGKLYVNYEAKNGRIFGMRRANSCYKLEDEIVIRN